MLEPLDLCARIAALIPPPRFHMIRYHGEPSSPAKLRPEVVPKVEEKGPKQLALFEHDRTVLAPQPRKKPWPWLLGHVFQLDVVTSVRCGGVTRLLEAATIPSQAWRDPLVAAFEVPDRFGDKAEGETPQCGTRDRDLMRFRTV